MERPLFLIERQWCISILLKGHYSGSMLANAVSLQRLLASFSHSKVNFSCLDENIQKDLRSIKTAIIKNRV